MKKANSATEPNYKLLLANHDHKKLELIAAVF